MRLCALMCAKAHHRPNPCPSPHPPCDPSSALRTSTFLNSFLGGPRGAPRPPPPPPPATRWPQAGPSPATAPGVWTGVALLQRPGQGSPRGGGGGPPFTVSVAHPPGWVQSPGLPAQLWLQPHGKGDRPQSWTPPISDQPVVEGFPWPGPRDPLGSRTRPECEVDGHAGAGNRPLAAQDTLLGSSTSLGLWFGRCCSTDQLTPWLWAAPTSVPLTPLSGSGVRGSRLFLGAQGAVTNPPPPGDSTALCLDLGLAAGSNRRARAGPCLPAPARSPRPDYASCFWKKLQAGRGHQGVSLGPPPLLDSRTVWGMSCHLWGGDK